MNLQILKSVTSKQWLIGIGAATVVVAAFIGWRVSIALTRLGPDPDVPAWMRSAGDGSSLHESITQTKDQAAEQRRKAQRLGELQKVFASMQDDIAVARKRLPNDIQKAEMVKLFYELARRVNVSPNPVDVTSVAIAEKPKPKPGSGDVSGVNTAEYSIAMTADQDGLIKYINLIEGNQRYMTVDSINLTPGSVMPDKNSAGKVIAKPHTVTLKVTAYIDTSAVSAAGRR